VKAAITLLALLVVSSGYFINDSFAEISQNQAFLLEGSGFAVTEESINISEIDIGLSSQQQSGSTINFLIEDGFITLNEERLTFLITARISMKLLEMPIEYAAISIKPNGVKKRIESGGISPTSGIVVTIAAKANPVDQAENSPHATPNPGINIGSAIVKL